MVDCSAGDAMLYTFSVVSPTETDTSKKTIRTVRCVFYFGTSGDRRYEVSNIGKAKVIAERTFPIGEDKAGAIEEDEINQEEPGEIKTQMPENILKLLVELRGRFGGSISYSLFRTGQDDGYIVAIIHLPQPRRRQSIERSVAHFLGQQTGLRDYAQYPPDI